MAAQVVFPGDEIATAEEFVPGPGTFEEDGVVYAARLGTLVLDTSEFEARVDAVTSTPVTLKEGDIVIGTVQAVRSTMAIVEVHKRVDAPTRAVAGDTNGTLHISKVAEYYVENLDRALRLGDIIRAQVVNAKPSLQLSTKGPEFGVLKSLCPRCRTAMVVQGKGLICPECEWKEGGKLAEDYGLGHLIR